MELITIRREVDADNSCLFSSIAYTIDRENYGADSGLKFRQIIVDHLLSNKSQHCTDLLELPKDQYIEYIIDPRNWGGAMEVKMFSDIFKKQIHCIDVKTNRVDSYGNENEMCIYLLYNGVHYDPMVMNFDIDSDMMTDITIFSSYDNEVYELMKLHVMETKNRGEYVDFSNIMCEQCKMKFANQNDAAEHMISTSHSNFIQI